MVGAIVPLPRFRRPLVASDFWQVLGPKSRASSCEDGHCQQLHDIGQNHITTKLFLVRSSVIKTKPSELKKWLPFQCCYNLYFTNLICIKSSDLQNPRSEFRKKAMTQSCHWLNLVNKVSDNTAAILGPKKVYKKTRLKRLSVSIRRCAKELPWGFLYYFTKTTSNCWN